MDLEKPETEEERKMREGRAAAQLAELGYVSLKNRKSLHDIVSALQASDGSLWAACLLLDCKPRELQTLMNSNKDLGQLWKDMRKSLVAKAEFAMAQFLESQNDNMRYQASKYILDHLGASEGYGPQAAVQVDVATDADKRQQIRVLFGLGDSND